MQAADFNVTSPGVYSINGTPNDPVLTLVRGETYTFAINTAANHPFQILPTTGVVNNNISSGTLTYTVPTNAGNGSYRCSIHLFGNSIITVPKPTIRIVNFAVSNRLVLRSTGTTNYTAMPEFKPNLTSTNWFALTVQSNRFFNGTNETFCGRPPDSNVFVRIRAQRN
jgi:hypothetical protein